MKFGLNEMYIYYLTSHVTSIVYIFKIIVNFQENLLHISYLIVYYYKEGIYDQCTH